MRRSLEIRKFRKVYKYLRIADPKEWIRPALIRYTESSYSVNRFKHFVFYNS